jgi:hypothetical protein
MKETTSSPKAAKKLVMSQTGGKIFGMTNFFGRVSWGHNPNRPLVFKRTLLM